MSVFNTISNDGNAFVSNIVYKTPGVTTGRGQNIFNCKYNSPPPPGKVCDVNIKDFKKCTQENNYSYHKSSPCIFIKLNRIYGWVPDYFNNTNSLPMNMPRQLKQKINETDPQEVQFWLLILQLNRMIILHLNWNIVSTRLVFRFKISWTPFGYHAKAKIRPMLRIWARLNIIHGKDSRATIFHTKTLKDISVLWLPFISRSQHVSQSSHFEFTLTFLPESNGTFIFSGGIIINVECKAWAYNIKHDRKERQGSVHFELMID